MAPTLEAEADPQTAVSSQHRVRFAAVAVTAVFVVVACRLALAVWRYSVNILFWDQWDFYTPLFQHASLWQIFNWQHGVHREGIGLVLDKIVLDSTRWNSRAEALFMVAALCAATIVALRLKQRLFGSPSSQDVGYKKFDYSDVAIPCLFLTFAQMESFVGAPNPSLSAVPELLLGLYCLAWMLPKPLARYTTVLVLNFLLIYSGYFLFMGVVTIGVLLLDLRRALRAGSGLPALPAIALLLAAASMGGFFYHYSWAPNVPCFHFPDAHPWNYLWFIALMMSYFLGLRAALTASVAGVFLMLAAVVVVIWHGVRLWRKREWAPLDLIVVILLSFAFLFSANAAIGRVCQGMPEAAQFSRYMPFMVPAYLAIYFHLLTWRKSAMRVVLATVFVIALIPGTVLMPNGYSPQLVSEGKQAWKTCILQTGNIDYCDQATGFPIYPDPRRTHLVEKLQFLQKNRLNLYSGDR